MPAIAIPTIQPTTDEPAVTAVFILKSCSLVTVPPKRTGSACVSTDTARPVHSGATHICPASETAWSVAVVPWFGSADLRGIVPANAFVLLPEGDHKHRAGQVFSVLCVE